MADDNDGEGCGFCCCGCVVGLPVIAFAITGIIWFIWFFKHW